MKDELFEQLIASVRESGAIRRGEVPPARRTRIDQVDFQNLIRGLRDQYGLSQTQFATMLGISVGTLRGWEQGRRKPEGPARILLLVAARRPDVVFEAVVRQTE